MPRYGFLGLGIMGSAMAANLVRAGFGVTVWNRTPEKCAPLVALGAKQAATPRDAAAHSEITFAMLADPAAARQVCFGPYGVLQGLDEGRGYVDVSTVDDATARDVGAAVRECGGRFLDAPVSGTKKPAEDGALVFLASGDRRLFDEAAPALDAMGKKSFYLGETPGQGTRMKLVINSIMGSMLTALCEGLSLGLKGGLEGSDMLEVLASGAVANPMFSIKGAMMLRDEFPASFPLRHMQKDMHLALGLGNDLGQAMPCAAAAGEAFKKARAGGLADEDFSALFRLFR
ncbi:NAD(P)-dependent oxidoreductase [Paucidesulfovibrio longus]|uniref:NAD(P)-dependent oxidoreductase n=1 Tax=Paucidesulfovibrio longus TaxID=889 RepID=UPI0003B5609F|nr:NAD(P)-dependent oxidoreductase [Paucidesulfovibrio longus]